jgi:hypothetical protein
MPNTTIRFFKGSCPVLNEGRTITVQYDSNDKKSISMTCEHDKKCTLKTCPVKAAILSMFE